MRDAVQVLHERGVIGGPEARAALEIRRVWSMITGQMWARSQRLEQGALRTRGADSQPVSAALEAAYLDRYRPWAAELFARRNATQVHWLEIVYDAVVDERTLADIDRDRRMRPGRAGEIVREALELYATMARWR